METKTLEQTLVDALCRLQYADVDKSLIGDPERLGVDVKREQHFGFSIGQRHFLVEASCFCEVFSELPVSPLPNAPPLLAGLCNVRGILVPVYRLHNEWGITSPSRTYVFCVGKGEKTIALLIDDLPISMDLGEQDWFDDQTLNHDAVLSSLVEKSCLSRGLTRYRLDGNALGNQLLALATLRQREADQAGADNYMSNGFSTNAFSV